MHRFGFGFSDYTLSSVLNACCCVDNCFLGKLIHGSALKIGLDLNVVVGTALLDMYAKTGCLSDAVRVFESFSWKNDFMYNAMIAGYLQGKSGVCCGNAREALGVFGEMRRKGLKCSKFTFSSIVKACVGVGDFEVGRQIHAQIFKNGLQGDEFVGSSLVDLYSFFGNIDDGLRCFEMTPKLDVVSWTSAIAGCVRNQQFENALSLFYRFLANGRKLDAFIVSSVMGACADMAAGRTGEQIQLGEMLAKIKKISFDNEKFPLGVSETEHSGANGMNHHSEKLAVTFGIISLPKSAPVRVMKNLRVCSDCHTTMKLISKLEKREIILRDTIRFHHFKDDQFLWHHMTAMKNDTWLYSLKEGQRQDVLLEKKKKIAGHLSSTHSY
ncbi:hypothetical protein TSUD_286520 [Trifolium subterraneum]|uniref:DYW domain-containing protein n=1 Tax=Trifolium subterraneum TaxID=3900 RepID=A0A2Z6PFI6_TRISU|nr:hypothetical protein TSUD_286520 [Trifolium subterraneum]